jgi:UDP-N-acetylglucosamine 2-epimerase
MHHASAMVGNSSSGIIEAASLGLPVVNIGERQGGRERSGNVVDCPAETDAIARAIRDALAMDASGIENLYAAPEGLGAGARIAEAIAAMRIGADALRKPFEPPGLS